MRQLVDKFKLPTKVLAPVRKPKKANDKVREVREQAAISMQRAGLALVESGLSLRDAGELLEVKCQRVDQLLKELSNREPENLFRVLEARERSS